MKIQGIVIAAVMLAAANAEPRRLRKEGVRRLQPDAPPAETSQGEYIEVGAAPMEPAVRAKTEKSMSMPVRVIDAKAGTCQRLSSFSRVVCSALLTLFDFSCYHLVSNHVLSLWLIPLRSNPTFTVLEKVPSMPLAADSGSLRTVESKAEKLPGGSMSPVAADSGSMRTVEAKAEKTASAGSMRTVDAKAQKQQPGSIPPAYAGSMRTVEAKAEKTPPDGGSMRLAESTPAAKAEKTPADAGSMRTVDAKAEKLSPGSMPAAVAGETPAPKAEKTPADGASMRSVDTKAKKHTPGGSMSAPVEKESAYKVFSKASL
eukprot:CCRYP_010872-RA/>CCRYP_010872-RA protein AED:0.08 eAED:0.08 QI:152/1/1/1/0.75/0.6/5/1269/315